MLDQLRGRLMVSCQPVTGGAMDRPEIVAAMAKAALDGAQRGFGSKESPTCARCAP